MKNFILLLLGAFLTCTSALAQTDEGSTDDNGNITPGWKVVANVLEPTGVESVEYEMIPTGVTKTGALSQVYYATVDLFVFPEKKKTLSINMWLHILMKVEMLKQQLIRSSSL